MPHTHRIGLDDPAAVIDSALLAGASASVEFGSLSQEGREAAQHFVDRYANLKHPISSEDWESVRIRMNDRFCDFPEPIDSPLGGLTPLAYTVYGGSPRATNLTWTVAVSGQGTALTRAVQAAFGIWSAAAGALQPRMVAGPDADVVVEVGALPPNRLGSTEPNGSKITIASGVVSGSPRRLSVVVLHEVGHALRLLHSTNPNAVMYPFANDQLTLTDDDVSAIRAEYGWSPQRRVSGRATATGVAITSFFGQLVMVWRGAGDDSQIYWSTSADSVTWSPQQIVVGAGTSDVPTLEADENRLVMAWKGVSGDSGIYWAAWGGVGGWGPVAKVDGVGSSESPTLGWRVGTAPGAQTLYMAWKGADDDQGLYFSRLDSNSWTAQQKVGGAGSYDRPALATGLDGDLCMMWRGVDDDERLYWSVLHGMFWEPQQQVQWIVPGNGSAGTAEVNHPLSAHGPAAYSSFAPSLFAGMPAAVNKVFLAWHGTSGDDGLYFTQQAVDVDAGRDVVRWSSQAVVAGVGSAHRPALAVHDGVLRMAWKGASDDSAIYISDLGIS